ncbi:hypothetical protein CPBF426_40960 [Xanthomonas arboricola pv. juglandis]|nr:hypothetical protein CPBF426_40960 [Xanthomonas arboricola pv. juglandis]
MYYRFSKWNKRLVHYFSEILDLSTRSVWRRCIKRMTTSIQYSTT